ncbi:IclR family acetate operon transcriptional repressor [Variovorax sp. TBS-050B]|uniref:IclR family transcriptional regulator n=1 Tax=Variovorax sp. TBS-050B TaxID=2940551 RepID=UPI0024765006|nr:IclR family transcriptional regulator [Variovorax sp. TBS-050B]MDH6590308.1 IclR family acetate operon transcriptional repressor [Variovorax sp. TBS-050B]
MTANPTRRTAKPSPVIRLERDSDGTVQSLTRAMQLLELLAEDDEGYRLVDIAAHSGLSSSTVHRLLTTLEQRRFVQFDRETNLWYVGVRCFSVGAAFARRRRIAELALPVMRRLRDLSGESINLGVADLGDIVFVTQVESRETMRAIGKPGFRAPLHGTAMGQAILAAMAEDDVLQYLRTYGLPKLTSNTIARASRLHETLGEVRRAGYAVDDEQNALGLRCIAAAIRDEHGQPFSAISLVGPTQRIKSADFPALGQTVRAAADEITASYGGRGA